MTKLLVANREVVDREACNSACYEAVALSQESAIHHRCLISEYMSYMAAAGYSVEAQLLRERERGARLFLDSFPDFESWLDLPLKEQLSFDINQRNFVHYLFLRHLLPVPLPYILVAYPHLGEMGCRLMERDNYERYHKMACRLGYAETGIRRQFKVLLCLMSWTQKPLDHLTVGDLDSFSESLKAAYGKLIEKRVRKCILRGLPLAWHKQLSNLRNVLYHLGVFPQMSQQISKQKSFQDEWRKIPPDLSAIVYRYLQQMTLHFRPTSLRRERGRLLRFFAWLAETMPEVVTIKHLHRRHIEAFKDYLRWAPLHPRYHRPSRATLSKTTQYAILITLYRFFQRIIEWQWPEAPDRPLVFSLDLPYLDKPLPRFLNDVEASSFLNTARNHINLFTRVCGITLLLTGLRQSEFLNLTADCVVKISDNHWLRVPLGKTGRDRYIPLHAEVKLALDDWVKQHPILSAPDFLFTHYGRRIGRGQVANAVERIGKEAGILHRVTPHCLRHTLATLAVNRDMPLESIAALLGHRCLSTTMVYARIANRTVQQEYASVSRQLECLLNQPDTLPQTNDGMAIALTEGEQMRQLRQDHWRMLGNGYCTRSEDVRCDYEAICESCPCFSTTVEFLPTLHNQRQDAQDKGQSQRALIFDRLIQKVEEDG